MSSMLSLLPPRAVYAWGMHHKKINGSYRPTGSDSLFPLTPYGELPFMAEAGNMVRALRGMAYG